jgi:SOS response regulatory protein OraA/RecX
MQHSPRRKKGSHQWKNQRYHQKRRQKEIVDLEVDSNFEGRSPIKWQDHEVETLIAIQGEMEEEFTKSTKKKVFFLQKNLDLDLANLAFKT